MGRAQRSVIPSLAILLLIAIPGRGHAEADQESAAWPSPGWQREGPSKAPRQAPVLDRTFQGLGTVTAPPLTALRVESVLVTGPAPVPTFGVAILAARVASDDLRAWGVRLPVFFGAPGESALASGNLFIERHSLLSTPIPERPLWSATWRLILPAATGDRWFLMVPGHDRLGGGIEGAAGMFRVAGDWRVHAELHGGVYLDAMMPLRTGFTAAVARSVGKDVSFFGQADPWVVLIPPSGDRIRPDAPVSPAWSAQLGVALGARMELGPLEGILAVQRVLGHANDIHVHLAITLHR